MNPTDLVILQRRGAAAWLTLNRPSALNALTPALMEQLGARIADAVRDRAVRTLVLTGAGRAFCAGVDLSAIGAQADLASATAAFMRAAQPATEALQHCPKPVIAAVNGHALAGGLELVLRCDLVVAAQEARFGDAHANFGLVPGGGSTALLPRRVGVSMAKYLIFTGAQVEPAVLQAAGLVLRAVPRAGLQAAVDEVAAALADRSPSGLALCKRLIDEGLELAEAEAVQREAAAALDHCRSRDVAEGLAAFAARRKPVFTGE